jgi:hypothetical protein
MRTRWILSVIAGVFCVILISSQIVLPNVFEDIIIDLLAPSISETGSVQLKVASYPALKMIFGKLDYFKVDGENILIGDVPFSHVFIEMRGITFTTRELMVERELNIKALKESNVTALITEEDLNSYFQSKNPSLKNFRVTLEPRPKIDGDVEIIGFKLNIVVEGRFIVENGTKIKFIPEKFSVEDTQVPRVLLNQLVNEWDLSIDLCEVPIPFRINYLKVEDGTILITSEIR